MAVNSSSTTIKDIFIAKNLKSFVMIIVQTFVPQRGNAPASNGAVIASSFSRPATSITSTTPNTNTESQTSGSTYDQVPLQTPSTTPVFNHGYDFAIPDDLLPFIPNGPLYVQGTRTKRTFIIPGSNGWFTEVRRLKRD
ncbi:unnamed protein product [Rhizophagus irregularis]|uniref:Uncharacterized protein n=1 Tax=Rhizophagus irregularis TaxID=588596 RepID=A0A916E271_9GLOM|nr:unnamed protein product [Rhizophagus irregularis]